MIDILRRKVNSLLSQRSHSAAKVKEERIALRQAKEHLTHAEQARELIQEVSQQTQQQVHHALASVVTRCLRTVFGEESYQFRIDFRKKRGKTEAKLLFVRNGKEFDPTESSGGGVIDVASIALRIASLLLSRPRKRLLLVADEPFKHLSRNHHETVKQLLGKLCEELGMQVIMVTHSPTLATGEVIELS